MSITSDMQSAVGEWVASGGDEAKENAVHAILESQEYMDLPYLERNRPFLTSSKLKALDECPYHAMLQYVDELPSGYEEPDYFVIGQAVDDLLTHGQDYFDLRYEKVARRSEGSERVQLTGAQHKTVINAAKEYQSRDFFPKKPTKQNVLFLLHGQPCKAELDHFDPETRRIGDIKTTSSITTFNPMNYAIQFGFYSLGIAKRYGESVEAELYVVDKGSDFSRSHKWIFSRATLMQQHYRVEQLAKAWKDCMETGIWPHVDTGTEEGRKVCFASDYWLSCPFCKQMEPTVL